MKINTKISGFDEEYRRPIPSQPQLLRFIMLAKDVPLDCKQWASWLHTDVRRWFHGMYAAGYVTTPGEWLRSGHVD